MDYLSLIKSPINKELAEFIELFEQSLSHDDGLLGLALKAIRQRGGKRMRPMLVLLIAKNFGRVTDVTQRAAISLELLHTASLVHDDVVDESMERRGQASVNASYNNKMAVLVGDYILSTSLLQVSYTHSDEIVRYLALLGQTLSDGEILQLANISNSELSEDVYYKVIERKTASLFETCAAVGAVSAGASEDVVEAARQFGRNIGMIFQIRDDIFDYYEDSRIGKPTGNDMAEGKLTLPVIYALNNAPDDAMLDLVKRVKSQRVSADEIAQLVNYTKAHGGIEYAESRMMDFHREAQSFIAQYVEDKAIKSALQAYLDYVVERNI